MKGDIDMISGYLMQSRFTTIGYTYKNESTLLEFLKDYNPIYINRFNIIDYTDVQDSLKSAIRDITIDRALNDDSYINPDSLLFSYKATDDHYVINLNNINIICNTSNMLRSRYINEMVRRLRIESIDNQINIILLNSMYRDVANNKYSLTGGSGTIYSSDLVLTHNDDGTMEIIKNRYA
tara:strand:+ start:2122 stop:2661 length:540 start_codon:yes stop_codon:yes gene_type:complete